MKSGTNPKDLNFFKKAGILLGFVVQVLTEIFYAMTDAELQRWIGDKEGVRKNLRTAFKITDSFIEEKERWRKFYQKHFAIGLPWDKTLEIPAKPTEGKWRLLIIAQDLTMNQVYDRMTKLFTCWKYADDLDKSITKNARDTKKSYAIWVRDEAEPDSDFLGKSTRRADPDMKIGVTVLERMIHEIDYFSETGNHLDVKGVTFCSGSRDSDGRVPDMYLSTNGEVRVHWYNLGNSNSKRGVRRAVTL